MIWQHVCRMSISLGLHVLHSALADHVERWVAKGHSARLAVEGAYRVRVGTSTR
jgi:hypothetical protein